MSWGQQWAPYVSVAQKLSKAARHAALVAQKQKRNTEPVILQGRQIAKTFWGKSWCDNLTAYQDYSNRLPRGATYVRNGSVVDLVIKPKLIEAIVAGSEPYKIRIEIKELETKRWKAIRSDCSESIDSLLDLLSGRLSDGVMRRLTEQKTGLFPAPAEIKMSCSCPDYSSCCKHLAAVMYGVGARLDTRPELLFLLRGVDHQELISQAIAAGNLDRELAGTGSSLDSQDLGAIFGIELDSGVGTIPEPTDRKRRTRKKTVTTPLPDEVPAVATKKSSVLPKAKAKAARPTAAMTKAAKKKMSAPKSTIDITASPTERKAGGRVKPVESRKTAGKSGGKTVARRTSR